MKEKLFNRIAFVVVFIFIVNLLATHFYWYSTLWWFDMPMHFLGGLWLGLVFPWLYMYGPFGRGERNLNPIKIIIVALIGVFIVGLLWEGYEYGVQHVIPGALLADPLDSLSDLFFDLSGGIAATVYVLSHISFFRNS